MAKYIVTVALYKLIDDTRVQAIGTNRKYSLDEDAAKADELYFKFEERLKSQLTKIENKTLPIGSVFNWLTLTADNELIREAIYADKGVMNG